MANSRAALEAELAHTHADYRKLEEASALLVRERDLARKAEAEVRAQFGDLKERLANAEAENARMRGYIARVQEDDVVREDLIPVGDPTGDQQLVPKRKATPFIDPGAYRRLAGISSSNGHIGLMEMERTKPRHWVTY